jgi:hypothetical protein
VDEKKAQAAAEREAEKDAEKEALKEEKAAERDAKKMRRIGPQRTAYFYFTSDVREVSTRSSPTLCATAMCSAAAELSARSIVCTGDHGTVEQGGQGEGSGGEEGGDGPYCQGHGRKVEGAVHRREGALRGDGQR